MTDFVVLHDINPSFDIQNNNDKTVLTIDTGETDHYSVVIQKEIDKTLFQKGGVISVSGFDYFNPISTNDDPDEHGVFQKKVTGAIFLSFTNDDGSKETVHLHRPAYTVNLNLEHDIKPEMVKDAIQDEWDNAYKNAVKRFYSKDKGVMQGGYSLMPSYATERQKIVLGNGSLKDTIKEFWYNPNKRKWVIIGFVMYIFIVSTLLLGLLIAKAFAKDDEHSVFSEHDNLSQAVHAGGVGATKGEYNAQAMLALQQQTSDDLLKNMGIDPTHNPADMGCLVQKK